MHTPVHQQLNRAKSKSYTNKTRLPQRALEARSHSSRRWAAKFTLPDMSRHQVDSRRKPLEIPIAADVSPVQVALCVRWWVSKYIPDYI